MAFLKHVLTRSESVSSLLLLFSAMVLHSEEKAEPKKPEPPEITVVIPLGVTSGVTNHIQIRGQSLTNVTQLRFTDTNCHAEFIIKSKGKAEVPKELEAKRLGDTQLELDLFLTVDAPIRTNSFTVTSAQGESQPHPLLILAPGSVVLENEPNGGFRDAQEIRFGQRLQGTIREARDVDVFRFHGAAKQKMIAEVIAARFGSPLDSLLTLYDEGGHILAANDDSESSVDSVLRAELPADGTYFLSLMDAHDRGSPAHVYQLVLTDSTPAPDLESSR